MERVANKVRDKLFNVRPALFAALFLSGGILFAYYRILHEISSWWLLGLLPVVLLPLCFCGSFEEFWSKLGALFMLMLFFFGGNVAFALQVESFRDCEYFEGEYLLVGTVENRRVFEDAYVVTLRDVYIGEERVEGRLNAYLPLSFEFEMGISDRVFLRAEVTTNTSLTGDYGFHSDYITKKIRYVAYAEEGRTVRRSDDLLLRLRARMEKVVYAGMDETPAALTMALLTGDVSGTPADLDENMRYGGISHIFAVSGLNVGALFLLCLFLFVKTPLKRLPKWARLLLLIGILTAYSGICSFTASVVRAAVMCVCGYFVKLLGTGSDMLGALGAAGVFILAISPSELFGVGFQLSFMACFGLGLLTKRIQLAFDEGYKSIKKLFPRRYSKEEQEILDSGDTLPLSADERIYRAVTTLISASIAAQITTAPVLLCRFGYLSGWSLLLNFVFVPFTDGIFTLVLLATTIGCCLPLTWCGVLLYPLSVLWSAAMLVFETVDFSSFMLTGMQISLGFCVCYYGVVAFLTDKWNISNTLRQVLLLLFALGGSILFVLENICF